jgi:hypothetical protein
MVNFLDGMPSYLFSRGFKFRLFVFVLDLVLTFVFDRHREDFRKLITKKRTRHIQRKSPKAFVLKTFGQYNLTENYNWWI